MAAQRSTSLSRYREVHLSVPAESVCTVSALFTPQSDPSLPARKNTGVSDPGTGVAHPLISDLPYGFHKTRSGVNVSPSFRVIFVPFSEGVGRAAFCSSRRALILLASAFLRVLYGLCLACARPSFPSTGLMGGRFWAGSRHVVGPGCFTVNKTRAVAQPIDGCGPLEGSAVNSIVLSSPETAYSGCATGLSLGLLRGLRRPAGPGACSRLVLRALRTQARCTGCAVVVASSAWRIPTTRAPCGCPPAWLAISRISAGKWGRSARPDRA